MANAAMEKYISVCLKYVGYREGKGNANRFSAAMGRPAEYWCFDFLDACAREAGLSTDQLPSSSWVLDAKTWGQARGRYHAGTAGLQRGDLLIIGNGAHIELALSGVGSDGRIERVGGNTNDNGSANGDGVYHDRYRRASSVTGYTRPAYPAGAAAPATDPHVLTLSGLVDEAFALALQWRLGVKMDGRLGVESWSALQRFLHISNVDGKLTGQNRYCLDRAPAVNPATFILGDGGSATVRSLQAYTTGSTGDGLLGPSTRDAVARMMLAYPAFLTAADAGVRDARLSAAGRL